MRNGDWTQTVSVYNPARTQLLDISSTRTTALDDGGGNTRGWQLSNTYGDGTSYVAVTDTAGNLIKSTEYASDRTIVNQAGVRIETNLTTGIKTAFVAGGPDAGVPVQADGSFNLPTSSGVIKVKLNSDPFAGGAATANGQAFNFTGGETLNVQTGGLGISGLASGGPVQDRLINATGSGTEFNYTPTPSYVDPMGGRYGPISQNGSEDSTPEVDYTLTETRAIGLGSTGPTTNLINLSTTTTDPTPSQTPIPESTSGGPSVTNNNLASTADYTVGIGNFWDVNTAAGNQAIAGYAVTQGLRPGNSNLGLAHRDFKRSLEACGRPDWRMGGR